MSVLIETIKLGRNFGELKAVDQISFEAKKGDVLGFLGPNGAGKSTTMKLLTCFLAPSTGTAKVAGFDIIEDSVKVRNAIGYLPENVPLYGEMKVLEFLKFIAEIRLEDISAQKYAIDRVLELASLKDVQHQSIETLSKGFKRRVGLAQALIADPEILILDEPTDGLDPNQKFEVRKLITEMAPEKCIILSTHILDEVEQVCTRAVVIASGKLVADDTPQGLKERSKYFGAVTMSVPSSSVQAVMSVLNGVTGIKEVLEQELSKDRVSITAFAQSGKKIALDVTKRLSSNSVEVDDLRIESGHLDEVFRQLTQ